MPNGSAKKLAGARSLPALLFLDAAERRNRTDPSAETLPGTSTKARPQGSAAVTNAARRARAKSQLCTQRQLHPTQRNALKRWRLQFEVTTITADEEMELYAQRGGRAEKKCGGNTPFEGLSPFASTLQARRRRARETVSAFKNSLAL